MQGRRVAIVLLNLGGPDSLEAVEPFLFNLFNDPAILRMPGFVRPWLARLIASRRAPIAKDIYAQMGGRSPILAETEAQSAALAKTFPASANGEIQVFIAMRYWHPRAAETVNELMAFVPDEVVLLPLYPQFSTTTTGSSLAEFEDVLKRGGFRGEVRCICCYPSVPGFIAAVVDKIREALEKARTINAPVRVLFSAHGLPERIVKAGDPYPWQVEQSVRAVVDQLGIPDLDWCITYQSRVGPLKWIGPATDHEIRRAGGEGKVIIIVPVAFVSEHSETLVELDIEYRKLAEEAGAKGYLRVPTVQAHEAFIGALATLVKEAQAAGSGQPYCNSRICPAKFTACPNR